MDEKKRTTIGLGFYLHDAGSVTGPLWGSVKKSARFPLGEVVNGSVLPPGIARQFYRTVCVEPQVGPDEVEYVVKGVGSEEGRIVVHLG